MTSLSDVMEKISLNDAKEKTSLNCVMEKPSLHDVTEKTSSPSAWRWVVLMSSFLNLLLTGFGSYQAGVIKVALITHMDCDDTLATWLMSYYLGCFALTAPVGSLIISVSDCRTGVVLAGIFCLLGFALSSLVTDPVYLFCTLTLIGVGQGLCVTGALLVLNYYFPDQTSIVAGVSISGGALGIFAHPPLMQALIDWYGLRGALLISGAVALQGTVFGALMRPSRLEIRVKTSGMKRHGNLTQNICQSISDLWTSHVKLLTSWRMLSYLIATFVFSLAFHALMVLLPAYLIANGGLSPTAASFAISFSGVGSFFSRLLAGFLAHDPRVGYLLVFSGLIGVQGLVSLSAPFLISLGLSGTYAYCTMVGLYSGGVFAMLSPMLQLIVDLRSSTTAFGMAFFVLGVGGLLGPPLTEFVHKYNQHSSVLFAFIGVLCCIAAFFAILVSVLPTPFTLSTPDPQTMDHPPTQSQDSTQEAMASVLEKLLPTNGTVTEKKSETVYFQCDKETQETERDTPEVQLLLKENDV